MGTGDSERRQSRRLVFDEPLSGVIGRTPVLLLDLSPAAIRISHQDEIGPVGTTCFLRFAWHGRSIALHCAILRSDVQRVGSAAFARTLRHSALRILNAVGDADDLLKEITAQ